MLHKLTGKEVSLQTHNARMFSADIGIEDGTTYSQAKIREVSHRLAFLLSPKCVHLADKYHFDPKLQCLKWNNVVNIHFDERLFADIETLSQVIHPQERATETQLAVSSILQKTGRVFSTREKIRELTKEPAQSLETFDEVFRITEMVPYEQTAFMRVNEELKAIVYARYVVRCREAVLMRQQQLVNEFPNERPEVLLAKNMRLFAWLSEPLISRHFDLYLIEELMKVKAQKL